MLTKLKLLIAVAKGKSPSKVIVMAVKAIAEGKFGEGPRKAYWALAGVKTWITFLVGGVGYLAYQASTLGLGFCDVDGSDVCMVGYEWALKVAAVLIAVGLYDAGVRADPPKQG